MMRTKGLAALAFFTTTAFTAAPALAEDMGGGFAINGGATLVSDYRFRGISQTDEDFAIQGTLSVSHESGFYVTVWGSSIDDYIAATADAEVDLVGGWRHTYGGTTVDVGILYYYYPGGCCDINTDFVEPYASVAHTFGPVTAKATVNYAPSQSALSIGNGNEDNLYLAGDLSATIPDTPVGLSAHLGHSFGPSYLTIGDEYTDWSLGSTFTWHNFVLGLSYVDTDGTFITPTGRNASDGTVVFSVGASF
jgi:uncharacterized protein (TIGR02001 family)